MADKQFPLSLVIKAVDKASGPLQTFGAKVKWVAAAVGKVGVAMSAGITAPLVALGGASVAAFAHFEQGMGNVATLVDTNTESIAAMGAQVLAISRRTPVAVGDLTDALYEARSAGVSAADQFKVLEGSARLAVVGLGSTKEAIDLVTSSVNAFGLKGAEAEKVYNTIFQATNTGKTTISGLAQGFGGVAGTVAAAGVKFDEFLAAVGALTTTGQPASQVYTQLKSVLAGLMTRSREAAIVFQRLRVKGIKELIATSGGLVPALEKIKGVVNANDTALIKALGGAEAYNAAIGLTGQQGAAFKATLETMRSGVDGVNAAFEKQNSTAAATTQRLKNSLEGVAISIGRVLVPVLEQLAPVLERAATWWEGLGVEGQKTIITLAGAAAALGPGLIVLGKLVSAVQSVTAVLTFAAGWGKYLWMMRASIMSGLVPSLTAAAGSVWAFTAALLANPITWVVIAVVALGAAVYQIYKNWGPLKEFFAETWTAIKDAVANGLAWIGENLGWTPIGMIVKNWEPIKAFFVGLWDGIIGVFKGAWEVIKPIVDTVVGAGRALFGGGEVAAPAGGALGAGAARPLLGAEGARVPGAGLRSTEARVTVDFANLPQGARVTPAQGNTAPLALDVGYAMGVP